MQESPRSLRENPVQRTALAGALTVVNLALKAVVQLALVALIVRFLGREGAGLWVVLQAVAVYLALSEMGIAQTMINLVGRQYALGDPDGMRRTFTTSFLLYWIVVVPVGVVAIVAVAALPVERWLLPTVAAGSQDVFRTALLIAVPLTLLRVPLSIFSAALVALRHAHLRQCYEIALSVTSLVATAVALLAGAGLIGVVAAFNSAYLVVMLAVAFFLPQLDGGVLRLSRGDVDYAALRPLFANSAFFLVIGLALFADQSVGNLIVAKFGDVASVPVMFVMLTLLRVFGAALVTALSTVLQPYVIRLHAEQDAARLGFFAGLATKASVLAAVLITVVVWLLSETITEVWIGPGLSPPLVPMVLLGMAFMLESVFTASSNFLIAMNRHHGLSGAFALKAIFAIGFATGGALLLPERVFEGITGGFLAAALVLSLTAFPWITRRGLGLRWSTYLREFLAKPAALLLVPLVAVWIATTWTPGLAVRLLLVATASLVALALGFVMLTRDEATWLRGAARQARGLA